jgi:ABC-2 type transport system permease protein
MLIAASYLGYAIACAVPQIGAGTVLLALAAVVLSFWVRFAIMTLFSLLELIAVGADASRFLGDIFHAANDRPVDVFDRRIRVFLLYIVPIGALSTVPAAIVLGRYSWPEALLTVSWLLLLGLLVFAAWKRGFRRYQSAMG